MKLQLTFIQDDMTDGVEVIVKAKEKNADVERVLKLLDEKKDTLLCNSITENEEIDLNEIVIISKNGRLLSVKTRKGEFVLNEPLYKIEEKLDPNRFVKISQSEIVNLQHVERWSLDGGGIIKIELINGIKSYTSRRYAVEIRKILKKGGKR